MNIDFWKNKRVLITGHTGFKGSWLCLYLQNKGANIIGYSLSPPTQPSLFEIANVASGIRSEEGDIRDIEHLKDVFSGYQPEIVIHMAAQSLVRHSYFDPMETFTSNVMGTVNILETVRQSESVRVVIIVTSDKCYDNREWLWGYRENEPLGGIDPYSSSKACAELITASYRSSFFVAKTNGDTGNSHIASVRAGNVIGGGDWAQDRLIPDIMKGFLDNTVVTIRNPYSVRHWQHVLEPLSGYMLLAEKMWESTGEYDQAWNFGPNDEDGRPVSWIAQKLCATHPINITFENSQSYNPHEASILRLDCTKAREILKWRPKLNLQTTLDWIMEWYSAHKEDKDMRQISLDQINRYETWR